MTHGAKFGGERGGAFRRPEQGAFGVPTGGGIDQAVEIGEQRRVFGREFLAAAAFPPTGMRSERRPRIIEGGAGEFPDSSRDSLTTKPGDLSQHFDPAMTQAASLSSSPQPQAPLG
jgi:hypothetical protein